MFTALLFFTSTVFAQVTLEHYLDRLTQTHPLFTGERLTADVEAANREALRGAEDWQLSARPFISYDQPTSASSFSADDAAALGVDVGLERRSWDDGSSIGLRYNYQQTHQDAATFPVFGPDGQLMNVETGLPRFFQHSLLLNYTLPLLRNKGGDLDRLEYDVREFAVKAARLQAAENEEDFLLRAATRFVDWAEAERLLAITRGRQKLAETQRESVMDRRLDNLSTAADEARAEADWNLARQGTLLAEARRNAVRSELVARANWPALQRAQPVFDLLALPPFPGVLENSRLVELFTLESQRVRREQQGLVQEEKPTLNLDLRGGLAGGDRDFIDGFVLDRPNVQAALVYRVPLGNTAVKAREEAADLRLEKIAADQKNVIRRLETSLRALKTQIVDTGRLLQQNKAQIRAAVARTEAELDEYERGKNLLSFVIQSQNAEAAAEISRINNGAALQKLFLEYRALIDDLHLTPPTSPAKP